MRLVVAAGAAVVFGRCSLSPPVPVQDRAEFSTLRSTSGKPVEARLAVSVLEAGSLVPPDPKARACAMKPDAAGQRGSVASSVEALGLFREVVQAPGGVPDAAL